MNGILRTLGAGLVLSVGVVACGGGGGGDQPLNIDYSNLKIAESAEAPLEYARDENQILAPLRNGVRLAMGASPVPIFTAVPGAANDAPAFSRTTVQIDGVDEADALKFDGRYIYSARPELMPASSTAPQLSRNVLSIARTNSANATVERVGKFVIEGEQNTTPSLYLLSAAGSTATDYVVALSQYYQAWLLPANPLIALDRPPDRTTIQLLDVRDPLNVSQAWKLEIDGWNSASRMIGDTLYLVTSYRPRLPSLVFPADSVEKRENNERLVLRSSASTLLPGYSENGGARRALVRPTDCLIKRQLASNEGYTDLVVISAIDLRNRRITATNCLSTNTNAIFMSQTSLYVAGSGSRPGVTAPITVLHKFQLDGLGISYHASGGVPGSLGWSNPSYFMDEHDGDLRILTAADNVYQLNILREKNGGLASVATLPNAAHPDPIGKPGESVYAVRFMGERGYVVTFRVTDPLYVLDLHDAADPRIAGQLEIPGFGTYLRPIGPTLSEALLSVGQAVSSGRRDGIKVELFDVRDIAHPRSAGSAVFGVSPSWSEALNDPHALTFLTLPGAGTHVRMALPIHVYDTPTTWAYSGLHLFDISDDSTGAPQLRFQGVLETETPGGAALLPTYALPNRGLLQGDSVFAVHGEEYLGRFWQTVTPRQP
jgi:hypothetical protein